MLVSLTGYAVDIRHPRVHVPAFADSYLPGVTVSLKAGRSTYKALERTGHTTGVFPLCGCRWRVARRSPRAFGLRPQIQGKCKSALHLSHYGIRQCAKSTLKPYGRERTQTLYVRYRILFKEGQ